MTSKTSRDGKEKEALLPWNGDDLCEDPIVAAFDMGGVTGWSLLRVHPEALVDPQVKLLGNILTWSHGQFDTRDSDDGEAECAKFACELVGAWPGCAVLMEDFILRMYSKDRALLSPVRLNAMLDYAIRTELNVHRSWRQQPSEAKTVCTDERLKMWGFYESRGGQEHARDADRHALLFFRKCLDPKMGAARRALYWPHLYGEGAEYYVKPPKRGQMKPNTNGRPIEHLINPLVPQFQPPRMTPSRPRRAMR